MPEIVVGSQIVRGPDDETRRETPRVGRRCSLLVLEGTVEVQGKRGEAFTVAGPTLVQWWPGEDVVYRAASSDARWLFLPSTVINPPVDHPAVGSLVRATAAVSGLVHEGTVVGYAGDTDSLDANAQFVTIDSAESGVSIIDLRNHDLELVEVPTAGF